MRELVTTTFHDAWRAARPDVDLALENEGRDLLPVGEGSSVLLTIDLTSSQQTTQGARGNRRVRRNGWIQVKFWVPANVGSKPAAELADVARGILEMVSMPSPVPGNEPLVTQGAAPSRGGEDGRWYMTLLRIPFWYVETK